MLLETLPKEVLLFTLKTTNNERKYESTRTAKVLA